MDRGRAKRWVCLLAAQAIDTDFGAHDGLGLSEYPTADRERLIEAATGLVDELLRRSGRRVLYVGNPGVREMDGLRSRQ